jgi:TP901 family phage tail tape measure protein
MAENRNLQFIITAQDKASAEFQKVGSEITNTATKTSELTTQMNSLVTSMIGIGTLIGAGIFLKNAIKEVASFDQSMSNISTLIDTTTESISKMKEQILTLSVYLPYTAKELSGALYQVRSAGISSADAMAVLKSSGELATAGLGSITQAVDISTSAMNSWRLQGKDAEGIFNTLFLAVKNGKTTIEELSKGFGQVSGLASNAGISLNEFMSATATLTTTGQKASVAYTQLRASITAIQAPTADMQKLFDKAGISNGQLALKNEGLVNTMVKIEKASEGNTASLKKAYGSVEAMNAGITLATNLNDKYNSTLLEMTDDTASLTEAFNKQMDTVSNQSKVIENKIFVLKTKLVETLGPTINYLMDLFGNFLEFVNEGFALLPSYLALSWNKVIGTLNTTLMKAQLSIVGFVNNIIEKSSKVVEFFGGNPIEFRLDTTNLSNNLDYATSKMESVRDILEGDMARIKNDYSSANVSYSDSVNLMALSQEEFTESLEKTSGSTSDLIPSIEKLKTSFSDLSDEASDDIKKINDSIVDLKKEATDLLESQLKSNSETASSIGEAYVEQADKVKELSDKAKAIQDELAEFNKDGLTDSEKARKESLQKEYDILEAGLTKENTALQNFRDEKERYITEIEEAQRRASLTDFERTIEDLNNKLKAQQEETVAKLNAISEEIKAEEEKKNNITRLYIETRGEYEFQLDQMTSYTKTQIEAQIEYYKELKQQIADINSSNITSTSISGARASGGSVNANNSYLVGELGAEVFTPSNNGVITPNNKLNSSNVININVSGNQLLDRNAGKTIAEAIFKEFKLKTNLA